MFYRKKNRVAPEVILQLMGQQAAERRRDEGRPPVRDAWAPVLADSGTRLCDIRVECEEDDPQRVWRLETMLENERARVVMLKTMLVNEDSTIGMQEGEIESLQEENERLQEKNERLQEYNERLRDAWAAAKENERLRAELLLAAEAADLAAKAAAKVAELVEGLEVALFCPISQGQVNNPVVSRYVHSYSCCEIEKWIKTKPKCPFTHNDLTKKHLVKNYSLAVVADAFNAYQAPAAEPPQEEKPAE